MSRSWDGDQHGYAINNWWMPAGRAVPPVRLTRRGRWAARVFLALVVVFAAAVCSLIRISLAPSNRCVAQPHNPCVLGELDERTSNAPPERTP